jgi:PHD/YefM family antitoxin component YafN of YafNO toxin-antitoxin module
MSAVAKTIDRLVPISHFNKGMASKIFGSLKSKNHLIVLKNNRPVGVIISTEEYERLSEAADDFQLLQLAEQRTEGAWEERAIPQSDAMNALGLSEQDILDAEELEFE